MDKAEKTEKRLQAIERVLIDLLRENAHQFVGGQVFAEDSLKTLADANDLTVPFLIAER